MSSNQSEHPPSRKRHAIPKSAAAVLIFILTGGIIYSNSLDVPFLFDDTQRITENSFIRVTQLDAENMETFFQGLKASIFKRPVILATFAVNYYFGRYDVTGYHIFNIGVHILNGLLLFLFIRSTITIDNRRSPSLHKNMPADGIAFLSALLWLVHPLHTQSVTYIVQRMNSLAAMFYLISMLCYIQARRRHHPFFLTANPRKTSGVKTGLWFFGSIAAGILAVSSKQNAAALPAFIILYDWFFFQDLSITWARRKALPMVAVLILLAGSGLVFLGIDPIEKLMSFYASMNFTLPQRVLTELRVVVFYISLLVYPNPNRLNLEYDFPLSFNPVDPFTTLTALAAIIGMVVWACITARKHRLLAFCILWYLGNLVIESSVIGLDLIYEHRTYLPSMLISLLLVSSLFRYMPLKKIWLPASVICAAVLICSLWTYQRNIVWADELAFWQDCVTKSPTRARPHSNIGVFLNERGHMEAAITHFDKALKVDPEYDSAYNNKGFSLFKLERFDEAIDHYNQAIRINPDHGNAHYNLGIVFDRMKQFDKAVHHYLQAIRIDPDNEKAHYNLGVYFGKKRQYGKAIYHYLRTLEIDPYYYDAYNNIGICLSQMGRSHEAITYYSKLLRLQPDHEDAHYNMGNALSKLGRFDEAIDHYRQTIKINPGNENAYYNMGIALTQLGRFDEAIRHYRQMIAVFPGNADVYYNLAVVYYKNNNIPEAIKNFKTVLKIDPANSNAKAILTRLQ